MGNGRLRSRIRKLRAVRSMSEMPCSVNKADTIPGCVNRNAAWTTIPVLPDHSQAHAGVLDQVLMLSLKETWPKEWESRREQGERSKMWKSWPLGRRKGLLASRREGPLPANTFQRGVRQSEHTAESWAVCTKTAPARNHGWESLPASLSLRSEECGAVGLQHRYFYKSVPEQF